MVKVVAVTGTPGTGKSFFAKKLAEKLKWKYVDLNKLVKRNKLFVGYDKEADTYDVNIKVLNKFLVNFIKISKKNLVIDSHLSHYLPKRYVNLCIACVCGLKTIKKRLEGRKYSEKKIRENLDAEIFDVCYCEAVEEGHKVVKVNTDKKVDFEKIIEMIKKN